MRLVLTSGGIANESIEETVKGLLGRGFAGLKVLFCVTAANYEGGNMSEWLVEDLVKLKELGCEIDVCDINRVGKENFLPRFEWAEMLYFEGGNTQWLRRSIKESGLEEHLPKLLETRVWVGASAGSTVLCPTVYNSCQDLFDEYLDGFPKEGLGLVNFQFVPHLNNPHFNKVRKENLEYAKKKLKVADGKRIYVMDDEGTVVVDNGEVKVVSEGEWMEAKVGL